MTNKPVVSRPQGRAQATQLLQDVYDLRPSSTPPVFDEKTPATLCPNPPTHSDAAVAKLDDLHQPTAQPTTAVIAHLPSPRFTWSLAQAPCTKGPRGEKADSNHASMKPMLATVKGFKDRSKQ